MDLHQVLARRWKYACPPTRLFDALKDERRSWLLRQRDEPEVRVFEAARPERMILRPWLDGAVFELELLIVPAGAGCQLTLVAFAEHGQLDVENRKRIRHRLGTSFGADLRRYVDGW
jgi:hypothetical protein